MPYNTVKSSPVLTRSNSSSATKQIKGTDDILKAIECIRSSQDKLLAAHNSLGNELKSSLNTLTSRFDSLATEISELRNKVDHLESKVLALESNNSANPSSPITDVIQEFTERDRCKFNVIMHGIPESTSTNFSTRVNDDKIIVRDIFLILSTDIPNEFKPFRLGKPTSSTSRPIKVIFGSHDAASIALTSFRCAKAQNRNYLPLTSLVRDKTLLERQQLRTCHLELERRSAAGEIDLTISYINGTPNVISRSKNSARNRPHPPA